MRVQQPNINTKRKKTTGTSKGVRLARARKGRTPRPSLPSPFAAPSFSTTTYLSSSPSPSPSSSSSASRSSASPESALGIRVSAGHRLRKRRSSASRHQHLPAKRRCAADYDDTCDDLENALVIEMNPVCCVCKGSQNEESGAMIYYCTCTGGPASAHSACISALVSAVYLAESHLCETCGRKTLVDKGDGLSLKMSSRVELEAPRVIDPDLSWKTDQKTPKGNKRAIRRARTALTGGFKKTPPTETSPPVEDKREDVSKTMENISVSESDKLGVSILGRRLSGTIVSVPIKKRRIPLVRSPSPPPRTPSPHATDPDCDTEKTSPKEPEEALLDPDKDCHVPVSCNISKELKEVISAERMITDAYASEPKMETTVPVQSISPPEQAGDAADFSGISVLATAACNSGPGNIADHLETTVGHFSSGDESRSTIGVNGERLSEQNEDYYKRETSYDSGRADVDSGNEVSVGRIGISDGACSVSQKGNGVDGVYTTDLIHTAGSVSDLNKLPSTSRDKGREASGKTESFFSWKDRASWDLNTVMDEWGSPLHGPGSATGEDGIYKESTSGLELHQVTMDGGDEREENLEAEMPSDYLLGNAIKVEHEDGPKSEGGCCNISQLHMQLCLASSSESTPIKELTDFSSSRVSEYVVEHCETVSLQKSESQTLVVDAKLSEEPVYARQSCESCRPEDDSFKGLPGTEDDALVKAESRSSDIKINESNGSSEEKECSFEIVGAVADAELGFPGTKTVVDKIVRSSEGEKSPSNESIACTHTGLTVAGWTDQGCEPAEDTDVHFNSNEKNVIIGNSIHPCESDPQVQCAAMLEETTRLVADGVDKDLITDFGTSLVDNETNRSNDHNHRCPPVASAEGEEYCVKDDTGNGSSELDAGAINSSDTAVTHLSFIVENINDDGITANNVKEERLPKALGHLEVPLQAVDADDQVVVCPDIARHEQHPDLQDKNDEKNLVCVGVENNLISGEPVSVGLSSHSDVSKSCNDDYITSLVEDIRFDNYESDYESDVSPRLHNLETSDMEISDEPRREDDQFEDGEFRSVVHALDEDAVDDVEAEHVDYGYSNNREVDDLGAAIDDHSTESLQVQTVESKGKTLLESVPSVISEEPACTGKNVEESSVCASQREPLQPEGSDTGPSRSRSMKVRKVPKSQIGRKQTSGKVGSNIKVIQGSNESKNEATTDMDTHPKENHLEVGNSSSPVLKSTARSNSPNLLDISQEARATEDGSSRINRKDVGPSGPSAGESLRRGGAALGRELSSQIEGPVSSDTDIGKERIHAQGSRLDTYDDDAKHPERPAGRGKVIGRGSSMHVHPRGSGGDWLDPPGDYWSRNRRRSPAYYGPSGYGHSRPDNAAAVAAAKLQNSGFVIAPDGTILRAGRVGTSGRTSRQSTSLRSLHGALVRRGSPTDQDEDLSFDIQLGLESVRDISPDRVINVGRDRSRGYGPRVIGLNPRERYRGALDDERISSSIHIDRAVSRRERSFSPGHRRGSPLCISRSHTKSPTRSRTRSPRIWTSPRRRNEIGIEEGQGLRRRSRSPNFRSDARMDRIKYPRNRGIFVEHMDAFVPTSRDHSPSPRASRWIDERRDVGQFREHEFRRAALDRSPPGRVFTRGGRRYGMLGSPRRVRADEYLRSLNSGSSPELDVDCREPRYDISEDERRKHGERYVLEHPVRPFNIDGGDRRFRYDVGDRYRGHGSRGNPVEFHRRGSPRDYHRKIESRLGDPSRRVSSRVAAGHFPFDREGMSNQNFRPLQVRDGDDDMASRRRRP